MHAGCPVIKGEKWSATKWIHVQPFRARQLEDMTTCADHHENCDMWAKVRQPMMWSAIAVGHARWTVHGQGASKGCDWRLSWQEGAIPRHCAEWEGTACVLITFLISAVLI